ncbi:MAG: hypothetical protein NZM29_01015, partial [Nitrospira sp.]|nr:hypothetical protein [Nitrospira sp.]
KIGLRRQSVSRARMKELRWSHCWWSRRQGCLYDVRLTTTRRTSDVRSTSAEPHRPPLLIFGGYTMGYHPW